MIFAVNEKIMDETVTLMTELLIKMFLLTLSLTVHGLVGDQMFLFYHVLAGYPWQCLYPGFQGLVEPQCHAVANVADHHEQALPPGTHFMWQKNLLPI